MNLPTPCPRVLVVEDDDAIRELLVHALCHEPLIVDAACDGREAALLSDENDYSLMLVDFMLPYMTGVEFLRRFRDAQPLATTVVLIMTALDDEIVRESAADLAHGFVRKPFDILTLVQVVSAIAATAAIYQPAVRPSKNGAWLAC